MLKFFRRIRQKLIVEGQLSRYLLYAIGEILLVMIGILLALQVNNWNEYRKESIKEREILMALADNLEINVQTLEADIETLYELSESSKIIVSVLDNRLPYTDSLDIHFHHSRIPKYELFLSQSGYEQFKNAGFKIIRNDRVKNEVLKLFESTYPKTMVIYSKVNSDYVPFTDYHVPLFIYSSDDRDNHYLKPINFQALYDDHYYIGWIRAYMEGRYTLVRIEKGLSDETKRVLQLIREELDRSG